MRRGAVAGLTIMLLVAGVATCLYGPIGRALATRAALHSYPVTRVFVSVERTSAKLVRKGDFEAVCGCHSSSPDNGALVWVVAVSGVAHWTTGPASRTHASGYVVLDWPLMHGGSGGFNSVDPWPRFWGRVPDLARP